MHKIACYNAVKWHREPTHIFKLHSIIPIPLECRLVPYTDAEIIFIYYIGNADHIPFIEYLLEHYPHKKFVFIIGENLHISVPILPKKISTKATAKKWARLLFPYVYPLSTQLFHHPQKRLHKKLFMLLQRHTHNPLIFCIATQDGEMIDTRTHNVPIFTRRMIAHALTEPLLTSTEKERYTVLKNTLCNMKSHSIEQSTHTFQRSIGISTVFSNTTKERVIACTRAPIHVYGKNPLNISNTLIDSHTRIYNDSNFVLCFENSSYPGYITEKLSNVFHSNAIPIYWGAPNVDEYCNTKSLYHCKTIADITQLSRYLKDHTTHPIDPSIIEKSEQPYFLDRNIDFLINQYETTRYKLLQFINA